MFDRYVQGTKPSWKRRAVLTVSLALHGIAAVVLVVYSFVHVEEITPPALSLTFFCAPPPPPPPPPPAKKHTEVKHIEKKIVTPTTVPQLVQPKQEEEKKDEDDGEEGGVEGGVAGGVKGGVVGGVVGGTGAPTAKPKNVPWAKFDQDALFRPNSAPARHRQDSAQGHRRGRVPRQDLRRPVGARDAGEHHSGHPRRRLRNHEHAAQLEIQAAAASDLLDEPLRLHHQLALASLSTPLRNSILPSRKCTPVRARSRFVDCVVADRISGTKFTL